MVIRVVVPRCPILGIEAVAQVHAPRLRVNLGYPCDVSRSLRDIQTHVCCALSRASSSSFVIPSRPQPRKRGESLP